MSESQNGTWRNEPASGEGPVFYNGVSDIENAAGDVNATWNQYKSHQTAKNYIWNWKT